jgi:hypothetical protein
LSKLLETFVGCSSMLLKLEVYHEENIACYGIGKKGSHGTGGGLDMVRNAHKKWGHGYRNLVSQLVQHERLETTVPKVFLLFVFWHSLHNSVSKTVGLNELKIKPL